MKRALDVMDPERRQRILDRLKLHVEETDSAKPEDIVLKPRLCPMNEDGSCQVYENRAVMCRNHVAYDVNPCRSFVEGNTEGTKRINGFLQEFGRYVTLGSIQVLEHFGIDGRSFEMADAVKFLWENPEAMEDIVAGDRSKTDPLFRTELEQMHSDFLIQTMRKSQVRVS